MIGQPFGYLQTSIAPPPSLFRKMGASEAGVGSKYAGAYLEGTTTPVAIAVRKVVAWNVTT